MPEYRIYEFKTPNNNSNLKDKIVDIMPKVGIILIVLVLVATFTNLFKNPLQLFIAYPIFIMSLVLHELSHAYMADFLGDPTPRLTGRLSLNPLKHLDLWGTLLFIFCHFGWAKPVQVNDSYFKNPDRAMVSVALAGPLCNFLIAVFSVLTLKIVFFLTRDELISSIAFNICFFGASVNILLAVFNLIPIPPLDGSRLVHYLLPARLKAKYYKFAQDYALFIMIFVFMYAGRMINPIAHKVTFYLFSLVGMHFF